MTRDDPFDGGASFDASAALYDRARPSYPEALVNDLPSLGPSARVLEIAPGTGQLTHALATRGCHVTAVERGPRLAALLQQRLASRHDVRVVVSRFEEWPLPGEPFDLVVCATAFHWLDPAVRVAKSLAVLRPGGALAVIATHHLDGGTRQFFADAQPCYERWYPNAARGFRLPEADAVPRARDLPEASEVHRYVRDVAYDTASYLELLRTYSDTQRLPPAQREGFLRELGALIETRYGGRVVKRYLFELSLLHRA